MSNNLLFNWGNRSPEQEEMQRRLEEIALMEQVAKVRVSQTGGVGGGKGSGVTQVPTVETALLVVKEYNGTNFTYYVADYANNTLSGPLDTGISFDDYNLVDHRALQNKGYFLLFRLVADSNDYKMLFLDAAGAQIGLKSGYTSDLTIDYFGGRWLAANDYDARFLWYFDGETLTENLTYLQAADVSFSIGSNWDGANSSGFALTTVKTNGDNTFCIATNSGINEIFTYNTISTPNRSYSMWLYNMSNVAVIEEIDDLSGFYSTLKFLIAPTGVIIDEYSVFAGSYNDRTAYRYGNGNYLWIYQNATEYFIINYRAATASIETLVVDKTDYPNYNVNYSSESLYSYKSHPILDTVSIVFYNPTGPTVSNLSTVSACKVVYSVNSGSISEYDLKTPGPGTVNILTDLQVSKNTIFMLTDTFSSEYTAVVFTSGLTYVHPLGIPVNTYQGYDQFISGEKQLFYFNLLSDESKFFAINSNGTTCTQSVQPGEPINGWARDYDAVRLQNSYKAWRFNASTDSLVEIPRFDKWDVSEPYSNVNLKADGRIVETKYNRIAYTHTQMTFPPIDYNNEATLGDFAMDGSVVAGNNFNFGAGSSYFTNLYPGLFVLCAKNINISSFSITGNIGADGGGSVDNYSFQSIISGQPYTVYVKRVHSAGDPSINHIVIVKGNGTGISQTVDLTSEDDTHIISGIPSSATEIHYLLLSQGNGVRIDDPEITLITEEYLAIVHGKNIATILTDLNLDYANVTAHVPTPYLFNDVIDQDAFNYDSILDGGDDMYDGANIIATNRSFSTARILTSTGIISISNFPPLIQLLENGKNMIGILYYDLENEGKVSVKIYNTSGVLKQYIKTPHFTYDDFDVVGDRALLVVKDKEFDGFGIYYNTTVYSILLTSYKSKNYKSLDLTGFDVRTFNDTTWYD